MVGMDPVTEATTFEEAVELARVYSSKNCTQCHGRGMYLLLVRDAPDSETRGQSGLCGCVTLRLGSGRGPRRE